MLLYCIVYPPVMVDLSLGQNLDILQTAVLSCNATGYGISYDWTVGSGQLPSKAIGVNTDTLIVPNLRSMDSNVYTCEASNLIGSVNSSISLTVTGIDVTLTYCVIHYICFAGLPTVTVAPIYQSVEVTNEAIFMATANGVGLENFKYQWKKRDVNITEETNSTLILQNVNESHVDNYACYISNEYGDSIVSYLVFLYVTSKYFVFDNIWLNTK